MLIKILICIFALIFFFISGYLWLHRQTGFLLFTPERHPQIGTLLTFWFHRIVHRRTASYRRRI
ncbi:hypothetical protein ACUKBL_08005 [Furfurilactobacillus rossiae]